VPGVRRNRKTSEKRTHPSRNAKLPVPSLQQASALFARSKTYTLEPKQNAYSEEKKALALKIYYAGASGRGDWSFATRTARPCSRVGKILGMSKNNVYRWIKKTEPVANNSPKIFELDEMYWFIGEKPCSETRENVYLMTMVSREPRQIVGFDVAFDKSTERIQQIVDSAYDAEKYCTDGYWGYVDVGYPGEHVRNIHNKNDTFTVEGINADLRHYIPLLTRRSRCFARSLDTLRAVVAVFVDAYNRFGIAKYNDRQHREIGEFPFSVFDFL